MDEQRDEWIYGGTKMLMVESSDGYILKLTQLRCILEIFHNKMLRKMCFYNKINFTVCFKDSKYSGNLEI